MSRVAILGSGFGLYGYLPAAIRSGMQTVVVPERYQEKLRARPELCKYASAIEWAADESSALRNATHAILALAPAAQERRLMECLALPHLHTLFLEKPLATSPENALWLHVALCHSRKVVRVAYLFRYLEWAENLRTTLSSRSEGHVQITWRFQAHHFQQRLDNWKRHPIDGGGPLRFYGIHLIALLAEIGYTEVTHSETLHTAAGDAARWRATFTHDRLTEICVDVDTCAEEAGFRVDFVRRGNHEAIIALRDPFTGVASDHKALDPRVGVLATHLRSASEGPAAVPDFYQATLALWQRIEAITVPLSQRSAA